MLSIDLVSDRIRDARDNRIGHYFDKFRTDLYEPFIEKLGYSEFGRLFTKASLMNHGKHWSKVELHGSRGSYR